MKRSTVISALLFFSISLSLAIGAESDSLSANVFLKFKAYTLKKSVIAVLKGKKTGPSVIVLQKQNADPEEKKLLDSISAAFAKDHHFEPTANADSETDFHYCITIEDQMLVGKDGTIKSKEIVVFKKPVGPEIFISAYRTEWALKEMIRSIKSF